MAIDSMMRGNETETTLIVNNVISSTEIDEGDSLSVLKQTVNVIKSDELQIDFIVLDYVRYIHQFGSGSPCRIIYIF